MPVGDAGWMTVVTASPFPAVVPPLMAVMRSAAAIWAAQFALAGNVMKGLQVTVGAATGETVTKDSHVSLPTQPAKAFSSTCQPAKVLRLVLLNLCYTNAVRSKFSEARPFTCAVCSDKGEGVCAPSCEGIRGHGWLVRSWLQAELERASG